MTPEAGWGPGAPAGLMGTAESALVKKMTTGRSGTVFFSDGSVSQAFFQTW